MNKLQFIATLKEWANANQIDLRECHVSHGGSMLMLGLRESTEDIDLTVSKAIWDRLVGEGYQVHRLPPKGDHPEIHIINVTDVIDAHMRDLNYGIALVESDGILYRDAHTTLSDKVRLNRTKDQADIEALKKHLGF